MVGRLRRCSSLRRTRVIIGFDVLMARIRELAREYARDVAARKALGDSHAEYHAQHPKVKAYRLLIETGLKPKAAVERFKEILQSESECG